MKNIKIIIAFLFLFLSSNLFASKLEGFVVFGDSLSDTGNLYEFMNHQLPLSPPYFEGRFSNGPIWIEHLVEFYFPDDAEKHLENYAFGGAGILPLEEDDSDTGMFTLKSEIESYFSKFSTANPDKLYVVWIGSNNYLAMPEELDETIDTVITGIQYGLTQLAERGAKHIMVVNLPELGGTPMAYEFEATEELTYLSSNHNARLKSTVDEFTEKYPDINWYFLNVTELMSDVLRNPQAYGFYNTTGTCYEAMMEETISNNPMVQVARSVTPKIKHDACDGYLFFDPVHPSGRAHYIMAEKTRDLLAKLHIMFKWW